MMTSDLEIAQNAGLDQTISKPVPHGQACARLGAILLVLLAGACEQKAEDVRRVGPSGFPVPRHVSLKFGEVNARSGPSESNRILWVYRAEGLPVRVIAEAGEWRKICDPDRRTAWIHQRGTVGTETVFLADSTPVEVRQAARDDASVIALLQPRSIASLERTKAPWIRISSGKIKGWIRQDQVWGTSLDKVCR